MKKHLLLAALFVAAMTQIFAQTTVDVNRWVSPVVGDFVSIPVNKGTDKQIQSWGYKDKIFQYKAFLTPPKSNLAVVNRWEMPKCKEFILIAEHEISDDKMKSWGYKNKQFCFYAYQNRPVKGKYVAVNRWVNALQEGDKCRDFTLNVAEHELTDEQLTKWGYTSKLLQFWVPDPRGNTPPVSTCAVAFSSENYTGQQFEMCSRGKFNVPFEVKSVRVPDGYELAYVNNGSECFSDIPLNIISGDKPSLADDPPCPSLPFHVISYADCFNTLKVTLRTGGDDLRGGNRFFFTLHMNNGSSFPEVTVVPPNGLGSNSIYSFVYSVCGNNVSNKLNFKDIAGFTIRHDGSPRPGHPFDTYDNWDLNQVTLEWGDSIIKRHNFSPTRFTGQMHSKRFNGL